MNNVNNNLIYDIDLKFKSQLFKLFLSEKIDSLLKVSNVEKVLSGIIIISMFLLISLVDKKTEGFRYKDNNVTITTMLETKELENIISNNKKDLNNEINNEINNEVKNEVVTITQSNVTSNTQTQTKTYRIINLNSATLEDLMTLSGIGKETATNIISYRDKNGPFKNINDLLKVNGIGNKKIEKIKKYIEV